MRGLLAGTLFWLMAAAGGVTLAPCLILPAWLDYKAARGEHAAEQRRLAQLERRLAGLTRQIEHQQNDPAYIERLAQREFGLEIPGVETIDPGAAGEQNFAAIDEVETIEDPGIAPPALDAMIAETMREYPLTQLYLREPARPMLMILGGGLIVMAVALLGRPVGRRPVESNA